MHPLDIITDNHRIQCIQCILYILYIVNVMYQALAKRNRLYLILKMYRFQSDIRYLSELSLSLSIERESLYWLRSTMVDKFCLFDMNNTFKNFKIDKVFEQPSLHWPIDRTINNTFKLEILLVNHDFKLWNRSFFDLLDS